MNKIRIFQNQIEPEIQDSTIEIKTKIPTNPFEVLQIKIKVKQSTTLELSFEDLEESKMDISFEVLENISFEVLEIRKNNNIKVQYEYQLNAYSDMNITKFYDCNQVKELDLIQLNGEHASIHYRLKTIAKAKERFDLVVYHNATSTTSEIVNHGVSIEDGSIDFQVTSIVYQGIKDCILNQNNRIITMNHHKCNIEPILLIEENDVVANHSAYIGQFHENELFYLMSRGIPRTVALQLLIKGFLLESIQNTDSISQIIEQYWR